MKYLQFIANGVGCFTTAIERSIKALRLASKVDRVATVRRLLPMNEDVPSCQFLNLGVSINLTYKSTWLFTWCFGAPCFFEVADSRREMRIVFAAASLFITGEIAAQSYHSQLYNTVRLTNKYSNVLYSACSKISAMSMNCSCSSLSVFFLCAHIFVLCCNSWALAGILLRGIDTSIATLSGRITRINWLTSLSHESTLINFLQLYITMVYSCCRLQQVHN